MQFWLTNKGTLTNQIVQQCHICQNSLAYSCHSSSACVSGDSSVLWAGDEELTVMSRADITDAALSTYITTLGADPQSRAEVNLRQHWWQRSVKMDLQILMVPSAIIITIYVLIILKKRGCYYFIHNLNSNV